MNIRYGSSLIIRLNHPDPQAFPPAPALSKVDKELEDGTYFENEAKRKADRRAAKEDKQKEVTVERVKKRKAVFEVRDFGGRFEM